MCATLRSKLQLQILLPSWDIAWVSGDDVPNHDRATSAIDVGLLSVFERTSSHAQGSRREFLRGVASCLRPRARPARTSAWTDDRAKATTLVLAAGPSYDELLAAAQCWEHGECLWGKSTKMSMDAGIGHGLPSMQ